MEFRGLIFHDRLNDVSLAQSTIKVAGTVATAYNLAQFKNQSIAHELVEDKRQLNRIVWNLVGSYRVATCLGQRTIMGVINGIFTK
jgi:hypothetical protein